MAYGLAALTAVLGAGPSTATPVRASDETTRPRVALVLSGGGARGAAHVGVLKVLEELQIPVDVVIGTSMGSIVGGLYAAGMSPEQIQQAMIDTDWATAFNDRPARAERYYLRKQDDIEFLVPYRLHLVGGHPRFPLGLLPAQKLENLLKYFEVSTGADSDFDRLPIPFRAVAADLANGEAVVLDRGSLATAMRASMSVPGIFPPVAFDDKLLVDGGVAGNLPVEAARTFQPDAIIAIDISTPLDENPQLDSPVSVIKRLSSFLIKGNVQRSAAQLGPADLLIQPDLGDVRASSFGHVLEAMDLGEKAARNSIESLRRYSTDDASWVAWLRKQRHEPQSAPLVAEIRLNNTSPLADDILLEHVNFVVGQPLDIDALNDGLSELYGLDLFEPISFEASPGPDGLILTLDVRRRATGLAQGLFNLTLEDDFDGGNAYSMGVRVERLAVNRRGGEWRADLRLGQRSGLRATFHQPLDDGLRWFVAPELVYERQDEYIISDGARLAQVRITEASGLLAFGRNLGHWGQSRIGIERGRQRGEIDVPENLIFPIEQEFSGWFAGFAFDTLDSPVWPSGGARGEVTFRERRPFLGGEVRSSDLSIGANWALTTGAITWVPAVEAGVDLGSGEEDSRGFELGGLFRLSGLQPVELLGDEGLPGTRHQLLRDRTRHLLPSPQAGLVPRRQPRSGRSQWARGIAEPRPNDRGRQPLRRRRHVPRTATGGLRPCRAGTSPLLPQHRPFVLLIGPHPLALQPASLLRN